jgi:hypothetical protein
MWPPKTSPLCLKVVQKRSTAVLKLKTGDFQESDVFEVKTSLGAPRHYFRAVN